MPKFATLMKRWEQRYDYSEPWDAYIARRVRGLVQGRRWAWLREQIWRRDKGTCQCCGANDDKTMASWELGHIIDRLNGGKDEATNLLVMCLVCNRNKPFHNSVEEFEAWRMDGGWWGRFARYAGDELWSQFGMTTEMAARQTFTPPPIDYSKLDISLTNE